MEPACAAGLPGDQAQVTMASWAPCRGDPSFLATINGSGCCAADDSHPLGRFGTCNPCSGQYTCAAAQSAAFPWGIVVAVIADAIISVGLALQKVAHNRVEAKEEAGLEASSKELVATSRPSYLKERIWWVGISLTIGAEVGNFAAYGDPNTPASVVASMGCVAVISNWLIAITFLGETFRRKDLLGVGLVVLGVVLIITFVPRNPEGGTLDLLPCPIWFIGNYSTASCGALPVAWPSGDSFSTPYLAGAEVCTRRGLLAFGSDYWYLTQPLFLVYLASQVGLWAFLWLALKKWGPRHVASILALADIAGGFTVCAAVTVSSFLFGKVLGQGKFYVLLEPVFLLMLVVLAGTAVLQVAYLNRAMQAYDASVVVPVHYVLFTLSSIVGPSILYSELTLDAALLPFAPAVCVTLFIGGIILTFGGVAVITSTGGGAPKRPSRASAPAADGDGVEEDRVPELPPPTREGRSSSAAVLVTREGRSDSAAAAVTRGRANSAATRERRLSAPGGGSRGRSRSGSLTSSLGAMTMGTAFALAGGHSGRSDEGGSCKGSAKVDELPTVGDAEVEMAAI